MLAKMYKIVIILAVSSISLAAEVREWTNTSGNSFEGSLISATATNVKIERSVDRAIFSLDRKILSPADNQFIDAHLRDIENQTIKEGLRKKLPDSLKDVVKSNQKTGLRMIVLYAPNFPKDKFEEVIYRVMLDEKIQSQISGKATIAAITRRDRDIEDEIGWGITKDKISVLLYTDLFEHTAYGIDDTIDASSFRTGILAELLEHKR